VLRMYQAKLTVSRRAQQDVDIGSPRRIPDSLKDRQRTRTGIPARPGARRHRSEQQAIAWLKSEVDNRAKEMR